MDFHPRSWWVLLSGSQVESYFLSSYTKGSSFVASFSWSRTLVAFPAFGFPWFNTMCSVVVFLLVYSTQSHRQHQVTIATPLMTPKKDCQPSGIKQSISQWNILPFVLFYLNLKLKSYKLSYLFSDSSLFSILIPSRLPLISFSECDTNWSHWESKNVEKLPPSHWPESLSVGIFLAVNWYKGVLPTMVGIVPGKMSVGTIFKSSRASWRKWTSK